SPTWCPPRSAGPRHRGCGRPSRTSWRTRATPTPPQRRSNRRQRRPTSSGGQVSAPTSTPRSRTRGTGVVAALPLLLPALLLLGALVLYPIVATLVGSFYDRPGDGFVGIENYTDALGSDSTRTALKNNLIWVIVAPALVTALGLVLAVL